MKFKLIFIFLFVAFTIIAQDDQQKNPNVELPDFVITGTSKVSIKKVDKVQPDFVSTISNEFTNPIFSPEQLEIGDFSNPIKTDLGFLDSVNYSKGNIYAGIGLYTIPTAGINYAQPFTNGIVEGKLDGSFTRAYVDNSDRYKTRAAFNLLYWSDIDEQFMPGTQLNVNGNYGTTSFKFFASDNPEERRSINSGKFEAAIKNDFNRNFLFGFTIIDNIANISQEKFSENALRLKFESLIKLSTFNLGIAADYHNHNIKNLLGDNSGKDFLLLKPTAGFQFTKLIKASFGWNFSRGAGNTFNSPYASVAIKLDKNVTFFGEFEPTAEFQSPGSFLLKNNYFQVDNIGSIYWEKNNAFTASIKYEYDKYFQIDGGFKYFASNNYPFFKNSTNFGKYILNYADMTSLNPYADFLFYLGPYGEFYSSLKFTNATDQDGNYIPYIPKFEMNAAYSYRFSPEIKGTAKLDYLSKRYSDIENKISIGDFVNLGLSFTYTLQHNLDFTLDINNLLNYKNYYWDGYKEIPLNIIVGINYRFSK